MPHPTLLDESPGWDPYELVRANKTCSSGAFGDYSANNCLGRTGRAYISMYSPNNYLGWAYVDTPPSSCGRFSPSPPCGWCFPLPSLWFVCSPPHGFSPPLPVVGFALPLSGCLSALSSCGWSFAPTPSSPVVGFSPPCFHIRCLCQKHSCSCGRLFLPKEEEKETENEKRNRQRKTKEKDGQKETEKARMTEREEKRERRRSREKDRDKEEVKKEGREERDKTKYVRLERSR